MVVKLYIQTALQFRTDENYLQINNKVSGCQCGFLNCLKYLLNNLLMLFYFSNVERQRTFSFSEFFCHDFLHHKNGGRTQFWARPVKFANATVNLFSFFCIFGHLESGHHLQYNRFLWYSLKKLPSHPTLTESRFTRDS